MNKIQFKPERKKRFKNILHYAVYIIKPFRPSFAVINFDTMKEVLQYLNVSKLNYAKDKFIREMNYSKKQLRNFYQRFDKIYDINLRLTIHISNFKEFTKPLQNLDKEFVIVTKTYFNHFNNKR